MVVLVAGCVVSDPPNYGVAKKTPPFLDLTAANPKVFERKDVNRGDKVNFNVPVRSEDAGDQLIGLLYLNYNVIKNGELQEQFLKVDFVSPSTLDDTKRTVDILWDVNVDPGCYQATMVVTHQSNLTDNRPDRSEDTAVAMWWLNVDDDGGNLLQDCPGGSN